MSTPKLRLEGTLASCFNLGVQVPQVSWTSSIHKTPEKVGQDKDPMTFHVNLLMSPDKALMEIAQGHRETMIFEHAALNQGIGHAVANEGIGNGVSHLIGIAATRRHAGKLRLKIQATFTPRFVDADLGDHPAATIEHGHVTNGSRGGALALAFHATLGAGMRVGCNDKTFDIIILSVD